MADFDEMLDTRSVALLQAIATASAQASRAEAAADAVPEILETREVVVEAASAAVEARDKVIGEPAAVRIRRDQHGDETFGEPETFVFGGKLFRQVRYIDTPADESA